MATPASIRSNASWVSRSVDENTAYEPSRSSPLPVSVARGRRTGTTRPPNATDPGALPLRVATRSGSWRPFGPTLAIISSAMICCITNSPAERLIRRTVAVHTSKSSRMTSTRSEISCSASESPAQDV